jgi:long-chain acyl-CoA synthetase
MTDLLSPPEALLEQAKKTPNLPYLHQPVSKQWKTYTWAEVADQSLRMAAALRNMGLPPGSRIGISGMNTAHWFMADFACALAGYVSVGMYPKQADDAVRHIIEHSEMKLMFVGPMPDGAHFVKQIPEGIPTISFPYPSVPKCPLNWDDMIANVAPFTGFVAPKSDDLWTLIYTSGTTGKPKAVVVTYASVHTPCSGMLREMPLQRGGDVFLSFLPLAHAFERAAVLASSIYLPAKVYFLEGLEKLAETIAYVRPTRFFAVPLVFTRIQSAVLKKMPQEKLDRMLAIPGLSWYVKRKLAAQIGFDRCTYLVSGAAAMPLPLLKWYKQIGMEVYQGYGMTENLIYVSVNRRRGNRLGSVGIPFKDSHIRISEEGEIQNKYRNIPTGYYKDPQASAELFTPDGWLRTGDKGHIDKDGYLHITGRVKEIFKTLQGKYVAPAVVEGGYSINPDVDHCCLVGAGLSQPMLLLCLSPEGRSKSRAEVEASLLATMKRVNATVEPHEKTSRIVITAKPWTIDGGLLSPTLKVRRVGIEKLYGALIDKVENGRPTAITWEESAPAAASPTANAGPMASA